MTTPKIDSGEAHPCSGDEAEEVGGEEVKEAEVPIEAEVAEASEVGVIEAEGEVEVVLVEEARSLATIVANQVIWRENAETHLEGKEVRPKEDSEAKVEAKVEQKEDLVGKEEDMYQSSHKIQPTRSVSTVIKWDTSVENALNLHGQD